MSKKQNFKLTSISFRVILIVIMLLITIIGAASFLASKNWLKDYAVDVGKQRIDANASDGNLQALQKIQQELAQQQSVLTKANLLKSTNEFPEFQIVDIVSKIASNNKVPVASFSYVGAAGSTATPDSTTSPGNAPAVSNVVASKKVGITVTLDNPVKLGSLLQFMYDIEQNVPKMQISGVGLSSVGKGNRVNVDPLTIEMYTK